MNESDSTVRGPQAHRPVTCGGKHEQVLPCTNCGRKICRWHRGLSPVSVDGIVRLVPVCHPECDSEFWRLDKRG